MNKSLVQPVLWIGAITLTLLSIPLIAMQFTKEVNWSLTDFLIMGALLFGTGVFFITLVRSSKNIFQKAAYALAVGTTFLLVWANLAVGLIGSGPNAANLMYIAVVSIVVAGPFLKGFNNKKMENVMFITAAALVAIALIQIISGLHYLPGSSLSEVILVNSFFAALYAAAGFLFRYPKKHV